MAKHIQGNNNMFKRFAKYRIMNKQSMNLFIAINLIN